MDAQEIVDEVVHGTLDPVIAGFETALGRTTAASLCIAQIKVLAGWLGQLSSPSAAAEVLRKEACALAKEARPS